jgi:hypothetical protein
VSGTNAIRVAATGGRGVAAEGIVADSGVAASIEGEQRTRRTLSEAPSVVFATAFVDARASESARDEG